MKAYHDFRIFYNQSIYPELVHLEYQRTAIMRKLALSIILCIIALGIGYVMQIFVLNLLLLLGLGLLASILVTDIRLYYQSFKPRIVTAILDFFDNNVNFKALQYTAAGSLSTQDFLESGLYACKADEFQTEDYISGMIREMPFELCEMRVADISPIKSGMEPVFSGVFIRADYLRPHMRGKLFILPDVLRKHNIQTTRAAHKAHTRKVDNHLLPEFEAIFDTFASPELRVTDIVSSEMQHELMQFHRETGRNISLSIINSKLFIALHQDADLLEPKIWTSNVSFQNIQSYFADIDRMFSLLQKLDVLN